ncbi:MAG: RHS repeat-associated core domain-containing protein [Candidatus Firestonebacteria bacterium]
MSYDAFGKVRSETPSGDTRNKNKFVGGYGIIDDSVDDGLVYMRARYYDSETGRFISRDPWTWGPDDERTREHFYFFELIQLSGIQQSENLYNYAYNNPLRYIDKNGKNPVLIIEIGGAAIGLYLLFAEVIPAIVHISEAKEFKKDLDAKALADQIKSQDREGQKELLTPCRKNIIARAFLKGYLSMSDIR